MKKPILYLLLIGFCVAAGFIGFSAIRLFSPPEPLSASGLRFLGFVKLPATPGTKWLSFLDYLSVQDGYLFVPSIKSGDVFRINIRKGGVPGARDVTVMPGPPGAHGVAYDPGTGLSFLSRRDANTVDVFDPRDMKIRNRIAVSEDADGIFFDPASKLIYVAHGDGSLGTLIDPKLEKRVGTISLGGKPEFAVFDPATRLLYQTLADKSEIVAISTSTRSITSRWSVLECGEPTGIALDEVGRHLFIVCNKQQALIVLSLTSHRLIATLPIGRGPDSVVFDAKLRRIYTTGSSGTLSVIQEDAMGAFHKIGDIQLAFGAHTLALDVATDRLFVGYASLFAPPSVAVFGPVL